ncbi:extracellular solute-binding protein [Denitrobaculum tricleocarpae]|uniref:Extracellular solute-binding protein n=1 Tax=Denitrobaculum tricleocarpae TaxID=2591009 RepID=A0A545TUJ4_9PROT|nr:extracellular solute-binding protein [Denitrobaculum tricleocarpae]TQV80886.1 extracellular solute-binding protein [Denitrobaculum tricleocarpae]
MSFIRSLMGGLAASALISATAMAGTLVINSDQADPAPKKAFDELVEEFKQENPDIEIQFNTFEKESYKTAIRNWLTSEPPDVVYWYAGNRMKTFVDRGLLEDVSDLWDKDDLHTKLAPARSSMTIDGKQWGIPYTYYQWGVYYRKDIFAKAGLEEPKTWDEFLAVNAKLKADGVTPIAIGTKFLWTAAGWFDYINMRVNGLDFHIELMDGKVPYTDERVRAVFEKWKELVEPGYYLENHASYSWQEAQPFLYNGSAAMYLIGNFITPNFPDEVRDQMGFFQFPIINEAVGIGEDAPTDTIHIPAKAKNKEDARKFLAYLARADVQERFNEAILQLPVHIDAKAKDDPFLNIGAEMLSKAGTAQFYDRDTRPEMAKIGMKGFQEFMVKPDRMDKILERLEKARKRIFKVKG